MNRFLIVVCCASLLQACGTSKAYEGRDLPAEELATLHALRYSGPGLFPTRKEIHITQVDDRVVGSYYRGFPASVTVKPGEHRIKVRYYDSNQEGGSGGGAVVAGILGGAIGGAIYGAATQPRAQPADRELRLNARPGVEYVVDFDTSVADASAVPIWIAEKANEAVVGRPKVSSGTAAGTAPRPGDEVPRSEWVGIAQGRELEVVLKSGETHSGRMIIFDGVSLWISLPDGGRTPFAASEVAKVSTLR